MNGGPTLDFQKRNFVKDRKFFNAENEEGEHLNININHGQKELRVEVQSSNYISRFSPRFLEKLQYSDP